MSTEKESSWQITTQRFVAFFDILGFKDLVERTTHLEIVKKLQDLKQAVKTIETVHGDLIANNYEVAETKAITFSDSVVIFSESDTIKDANKIIIDAAWIVRKAIEIGLGIKGAISYGEVTVDFKDSLFFGRPIIDAYLLHEQLYLYSTVLDNHFEKKINSMKLKEPFSDCIINYNTNIKSGKVNHKLICPNLDNMVEKQLQNTIKLYENVSGAPRIYIDNTINFLSFVLTQRQANKQKKR